MNKATCAAYVKHRSGKAIARRELEDLRAAVRYHWEAGLCSALTPVVLPDRGEGRERWLTRKEAALLLRTARRMRQRQFGKRTDRATGQHIARFILMGIYTGTRAGTICSAVLDQPTIGRSWVDLENGIFLSTGNWAAQNEKAADTSSAATASACASSTLEAQAPVSALRNRMEWCAGQADK